MFITLLGEVEVSGQRRGQEAVFACRIHACLQLLLQLMRNFRRQAQNGFEDAHLVAAAAAITHRSTDTGNIRVVDTIDAALRQLAQLVTLGADQLTQPIRHPCRWLVLIR
jgi:hypothetical protein